MHPFSKRLGIGHAARRLLSVGLWSGLCLFVACDHRRSLGGGFELRQAPNWNPDGHPGIQLYYQGREVWRSVTWGEGGPEKNRHGDLFFFETQVTLDDDLLPLEGPSTNAPASKTPGAYGSQLFAVKGAGIPVLISPRIFKAQGKGLRQYDVKRSGANDSRVTVVFRYWLDEDHDSECTSSVPWQNISQWLAEAERTGELRKTAEGTYRILRP